MAHLFTFIKGHHIIRVPDQPDVDSRLKSHVDLSVFVGNDFIVAHKNVYLSIKEQLLKQYESNWIDAHLIQGTHVLGVKYPHDIPFNAVQLKNHFFHKIAQTDTEILTRISHMQVNVNQGYTRCSSLIVDERSVISEDPGLIKIYADYGYDVLPIQRGYVELHGFDCGFFGGAGGRIENDIVFNGSLSHHPDEAAIIQFIDERGLRIKYLHSGKLLDCGSYLYYETET